MSTSSRATSTKYPGALVRRTFGPERLAKARYEYLHRVRAHYRWTLAPQSNQLSASVDTTGRGHPTRKAREQSTLLSSAEPRGSPFRRTSSGPSRQNSTLSRSTATAATRL